MRILKPLLLLLLGGCFSTHPPTKGATGFRVHPIDNESGCAWVVRNNTTIKTVGLGALDIQGQDYLYLCCPTEFGGEPVCQNPQWTRPNNNLRFLPSLEELEREARKVK
jgi:hypothetical protein